MAEEFDPNAFRQQMGQGQLPHAPIPAPVAPQQVAAPVPVPRQPQPYVPQQSAPQQYAPQPQSAPQQPAQYHPPQHHGQPYQQAQAPVQQQFRPQMQPAYGQAPQMPAYEMQGHPMGHEVQEPTAKKSLFKRKKLKAAATQMTPQMDGAMDMMSTKNESRASRLTVFLGGLMVGALGTLLSIMLFSGNEPQRANVAVNQAEFNATIEGSTDPSQMALTDEMLMESQNKGQGRQP